MKFRSIWVKIILPNMRSAIWTRPSLSIAAAAVFILLQVFLFFIRTHDALDLDIGPNTIPSEDIQGETRIGQTFFAQRDGLCRVDLMMGTHGRANLRKIHFRLWQLTPRRRLITHRVLEAEAVRNNLYFPIRFRPVPDSREREFLFQLESPRSTPADAFCVWMNRRDIYPRGKFRIDGSPGEGDLVFRVYSRRPIYSELGRIVRNYSGIFGSRILLVLAVLLFEAAMLFLLLRLFAVFRALFKPEAGKGDFSDG